MESDVIVIGAGPGGSASAVSFLGRGYGVTVLEKRFMPRTKVCGEMVAPLGVKELGRLGLLEGIEAAGANKVRRVIFRSSGGAGTEIPFREGEYGVAMSREAFDTILFAGARERGALGIEGFRVENVERERGRRMFRVEGTRIETGERGTFRARAVINASGLKGVGYRDKKCREFLYAFKIHLRGITCGDAAEIFFYDGGYGGLVGIEGGVVNLAFQVRKDQMALMKDHPLDILTSVLPPGHPVREKLSDAEPVGKWEAMGSVFVRKRASYPGVWNVGDASGIIDPFTGLGISLALQGGRYIGENLEVGRERDTYDLKRSLNRTRLMTAALLRKALFRPRLCHMMMKHASISPMLGMIVLGLLHT
ncbi:MAG TPA: FAD-dependent monooxygenase [Thermodesulfobacteriota bacterium]|nr:FAD-dependent monooxygenase [Thermodesulfobacteriota bacterium]